jgi:hypothetical protein
MTTRAPFSLFLIVVLVSACGEAATNAQGSQPPGARPAAPNTATPRDGGVVLEFDLPDEFRSPPAGAADAVTGFRVGYFGASDSTAIRTVDFSADALTVQGRTARVTLPRGAVPAGALLTARSGRRLCRADRSAPGATHRRSWVVVPCAGSTEAPREERTTSCRIARATTRTG